MLKSIRILLPIATHYDYEIWQMDVKAAFLNDKLEEEIYMMQPEGFIAQNKSIWYACWKDSFMDLSKHLGHGTSDLIKQSSHLVLNKILRNHVCTKDMKIK